MDFHHLINLMIMIMIVFVINSNSLIFSDDDDNNNEDNAPFSETNLLSSNDELFAFNSPDTFTSPFPDLNNNDDLFSTGQNNDAVNFAQSLDPAAGFCSSSDNSPDWSLFAKSRKMRRDGLTCPKTNAVPPTGADLNLNIPAFGFSDTSPSDVPKTNDVWQVELWPCVQMTGGTLPWGVCNSPTAQPTLERNLDGTPLAALLVPAFYLAHCRPGMFT